MKLYMTLQNNPEKAPDYIKIILATLKAADV